MAAMIERTRAGVAGEPQQSSVEQHRDTGRHARHEDGAAGLARMMNSGS